MKQFAIILVLVVLIAGGAYYYMTRESGITVTNEDGTLSEESPSTTTPSDTPPAEDGQATSSESSEPPTPPTEDVGGPETVLGTSAGGTEITAYHFGVGDEEVLFVGGIHGGYSWNAALLGYELIDYFEENPQVVPNNVRVSIIPVLNPDGLEEVVGTTGRFDPATVPDEEGATIPGRFNANDVDLNRNFDCEWQPEGVWRDRTVSGGDAPFSEPESAAVRDYIESAEPRAVVGYYSAAGGVYSSRCNNGILTETRELTNTYADAAGYGAYEEFDFYEITGDMMNWLASEDIPAISVLLTNHEEIEWEQNRAGVEAVLNRYAE